MNKYFIVSLFFIACSQQIVIENTNVKEEVFNMAVEEVNKAAGCSLLDSPTKEKPANLWVEVNPYRMEKYREESEHKHAAAITVMWERMIYLDDYSNNPAAVPNDETESVILIHELGHAFGLQHTDYESVMSPGFTVADWKASRAAKSLVGILEAHELIGVFCTHVEIMAPNE